MQGGCGALVCLWAAQGICGLTWKPNIPPRARNGKQTFLINTLNSSDHCQRKHKVSALGLWSASLDDDLAKLPIDSIRSNYVRKVKDCVFSRTYPTPFMTDVRLVAISEEVLENLLDVDMSAVSTDDFLQFVSGGKSISGFAPLTHRYGGHQFGVWAGQLGDGRAHLIATYINRYGERWELQLKGSGKTPYSRTGDGRAVLRSSVREFLCSEAMHYLGVPTSRAASLVVSDDVVWRDQFYKGNVTKERGAVVLRVAKSWFRIGSLEILTNSGEFHLLRELVDFIIKEHFPAIIRTDPNRVLAFFSIVVSQTADMIARWMSVGFAHGVCNTDNFSLLSITIDYGPFGFMESYDADYVPNTSDDDGRYRIGNQANAGMYNLNKLLVALNPLMDNRQKQISSAILAGFPDQYYQRFTELFRAKLGFLGAREDDLSLIASFLNMMEDTKADFTMSFCQLSELADVQLRKLTIPEEYWALHDISQHVEFSAWVTAYLQRLQSNPHDSDSKRRQRMKTTNPRYILRNWMAESAVRKAERNDFSEVHQLQKVLQRPFEMQKIAELAGYSQEAPEWAKDLKVSCSS
ncbi:protein adenylyltransferase SelO-like isoform X1 [Bufo bufo]|uniref:protein adenylyltransferase SelO-like isoform X1 n=1 Tax=Bufo bufo TaxID=8384 RepID=UPI001ABE5660|nr:protein adenylyltransferase SelO-like isoform X1 [Bufo bufo]XP_040290321.1 protein adenylyltransferase SelO-like isoform X1 [Bufo bufo]XP_040290322.1 protein adenylyltransferase SelO-like isoform X1 [Bufo bufo]XP_040290323.1 protein adenylyltransferase SelO-like isoform X1 [Bufo bufo]